jgi:putative DNA primase/helicase
MQRVVAMADRPRDGLEMHGEDVHREIFKADPPQSDVGNSARILTAFGDVMRFCGEEDQWYVFGGQVWTPDHAGHVVELAKRVARDYLLSAVNRPLASDSDRKALMRWALYFESTRGITAALKMAQSALPIAPAAFDPDPNLLSTPSGVVDLRDEAVRPHRAEDYITRMTGAVYDPDAAHPVFTRFLEMVIPDPKTRAYVQRALGYSATGHTQEEAAFFTLGRTASGKTTMFEASRSALGSYAASASFETFAPTRSPAGGPREDLRRLIGKRMVTITETPPGRRWAVGLLKGIAGRDPIIVRGLYQNSVECLPTFKLWTASNHHVPVAPDEAVFRRLREIPFPMSLAPAQRDPNVKTLLTDPTIGGPAVLRWIINGAREWYAHGLGTTAEVEAATLEYQHSQDLARQFLDACMVRDRDAWISSAELRAELRRWADEEGIEAPPKDLSEALRAWECSPHRRHGGERGWNGLHRVTG